MSSTAAEIFSRDGLSVLAICLGMSAPVWVPLVFAAYWAGKRRISVRAAISFLTAESAAVWWMLWAYEHGARVIYLLAFTPASIP